MSDQKSRFAVDLDELERQLRQTADIQPAASAGDPLADLARIVGQDDPFRAMFSQGRSRPDAQEGGAGADMQHALAQQPGLVSEPEPYGGGSALPDQRMNISLEALLREFEEAPKPARADAQQSVSVPQAAAATPAPSSQPGLAPQDMLDEFDRLLQGELRGAVQPGARPDFEGPLQARPRFDDSSGDDMTSRREAAAFSPARPAMAAPPRPVDEDFADEVRAKHQVRRAAALPEPHEPAYSADDARSSEPQQPRKGLIIAGVLLGVAAIGIGAVIGIRGLSGPVRGTGEPPLIKAEAGPSKVQPQNPGGVEIPNQNKQIYERTPEPKPGETRVVTREEQPMDVQASARAASRVILPGPAAPADAAQAAAPAAPQPAAPTAVALAPSAVPPQAAAAGSAAPALGEPRRVRTIAVRPDGTSVPSPVQPAAAPVAEASSARAESSPAAAAPATSTSTRSAAAARPAVTPPPRPPAARPVMEAAAPPAAPAAAVAAAPAAAAPAAGGGAGDFMIQLGAPGSEAEARSLFSSLQRRYGAQLGGESPVVRRAEVGNGRTVYRLRIGPFSREAAVQRCEALKSAGGQCFVAGS